MHGHEQSAIANEVGASSLTIAQGIFQKDGYLIYAEVGDTLANGVVVTDKYEVAVVKLERPTLYFFLQCSRPPFFLVCGFVIPKKTAFYNCDMRRLALALECSGKVRGFKERGKRDMRICIVITAFFGH